MRLIPSTPDSWSVPDIALLEASLSGGPEATGITQHTDGSLQIAFGDTATLTIKGRQAGRLFLLRLRWTILRQARLRFHLSVRLPGGTLQEVFVPSVWYRDNEAGTGAFPSRQKAGRWSFLETREPLADGMVLSTEEGSLALALDPAGREEELSSLSWEREGAILTFPGQEWPARYQGKQTLRDTTGEEKPYLVVQEGDQFERTLFLFSSPSNDVLKSWEGFIRAYRTAFPITTNPALPGWDFYGQSKCVRLLNLVDVVDGKPWLLMGQGNGDEQDVYRYTAGSFLVKGVEAAAALADMPDLPPDAELKEARRRVSQILKIEDDGMLLPRLAHRLGRSYLEGEREHGLWQDCHSLKDGLWGGYLGIGEHPEFRMMVNSRCAGEAMKAYLELSDALETKGITEPAFLELPCRVARFFLDTQLSGGSFGRWWTTSGRPENIQGTNGAYITSFLCVLSRHLDPHDPLYGDVMSGILKSAEFYSRLIDEGRFYGDTLDADSCDKEAGITLLEAMLQSGDALATDRFLDHALQAARFVLTWIWQDDGWLRPDSPMGRRHFRTTGMSAVSIANQHLDFYGMRIAVLFKILAKKTGDSFWSEQADILANACRQLIADEKDGLGRDSSFYGWQPEQMNHTDWDYFDKSEHTRGWFGIDIAWVHVLGFHSWQTLRSWHELP